MPPSNYPPGVTGMEPQITGENPNPETDGIIIPLGDGTFEVRETDDPNETPVIVDSIEKAIAVLGFDCGCGG